MLTGHIKISYVLIGSWLQEAVTFLLRDLTCTSSDVGPVYVEDFLVV